MAAGLIDKGLYGFGRGIGLSKDDVDNGVAAFTHYDKDGSGSIDVKELTNVFSSFLTKLQNSLSVLSNTT